MAGTSVATEITSPFRLGVKKFFNKFGLSSFRATKNTRIESDSEILVAENGKLIAKFQDMVSEPIHKGDIKLLVQDAKKFEGQIEKLVMKNENAQFGVIDEIRKQIEELGKKELRIKKKIDLLKKTGISPELHDKIKHDFEERFKEIFNTVEMILNEIGKQEIMVARDRTTMRMFMFKFESQMKQQLAFFYFKIRDLEKSDEKKLNTIEKDLEPKIISKHSKEAEEMVNKELKLLYESVKTELYQMLEEVKVLVHLVIGIEEGIIDLVNREIKGRLVGQMKLPLEVGNQIQIIMFDMLDKVQKISEDNRTYTKELIQEAEHFKKAA